jgi:hypothetical protein
MVKQCVVSVRLLGHDIFSRHYAASTGHVDDKKGFAELFRQKLRCQASVDIRIATGGIRNCDCDCFGRPVGFGALPISRGGQQHHNADDKKQFP